MPLSFPNSWGGTPVLRPGVHARLLLHEFWLEERVLEYRADLEIRPT